MAIDVKDLYCYSCLCFFSFMHSLVDYLFIYLFLVYSWHRIRELLGWFHKQLLVIYSAGSFISLLSEVFHFHATCELFFVLEFLVSNDPYIHQKFTWWCYENLFSYFSFVCYGWNHSRQIQYQLGILETVQLVIYHIMQILTNSDNRYHYFIKCAWTLLWYLNLVVDIPLRAAHFQALA